MSRCQACGGILGVDCFNQADCLQISHDLYINDFLQRDLIDAETRIRFLEQFILDSGLEIPYPVVDNTTDDEDWLPF